MTSTLGNCWGLSARCHIHYNTSIDKVSGSIEIIARLTLTTVAVALLSQYVPKTGNGIY